MAKDLTQRQVSSQQIYQAHAFAVSRDEVRLPDGRTVFRDVIKHPGAVVIVPALPDGRLLVVRQWRYAAGAALWEFPAGTLEPGEDPAACAERELQEEAGYKPGRLTWLGDYFSAPGFCTELLHCFLAEDLTASQLEADDDEDFDMTVVAPAELLRWAADGRLRDAKTLAGLLLALGRKGLAGG